MKSLKDIKEIRKIFFLKSYARSHGLFLDLFFSHLTFKSWKLKAFSILLVFSLMSKLIQIKSRYAKATVLMVVDKRIFSKIFVISVYDIQRLLFPLSFTGPQEPGGGSWGYVPSPIFLEVNFTYFTQGGQIMPTTLLLLLPPALRFSDLLTALFSRFFMSQDQKRRPGGLLFASVIFIILMVFGCKTSNTHY